jgi:hypothetical protein
MGKRVAAVLFLGGVFALLCVTGCIHADIGNMR